MSYFKKQFIYWDCSLFENTNFFQVKGIYYEVREISFERLFELLYVWNK